jgi:hypothetical protein
MNLRQLWKNGLAHDRQQHAAGEASKIGNLRAGDSGAMLKNGDIIGGCPRRAYVRTQLGLEVEPPSESNLIMFELGKANETVWVDKLKRVWKGSIRCEEEIPIAWSTSSGARVTGRPDVVLCDEAGRPVLGIEHKAVCSVWTAKSVSFEVQPKVKHVVQAAHYAWQLRIPYRLVYTQYVNYAVPQWAGKMFGSQPDLVETNDKGEIKHVKPHETIYELSFDDKGQVLYRLEPPEGADDNDHPYTVTVLNVADIERYYEYVAQMHQRKVLGQRPKSVKLTGQKASYDECSYCPLFEQCEKHEDSWERWIENVQRQIKGH